MTTYDFTPPPPGLVQQWEAAWHLSGNTNGNRFLHYIAAQAAQWGYEQCLKQYELAAMDIVLPSAEMLGADND